MKDTCIAACGVLALAGTITLSAQTPVPPPTTQPPAPSTGADASTITVTGCLKPWDNTMGTAPADPALKPGTTPMAGTRYVLTDLETGTPMDRAPAATPPTPAPAPPAHPRASRFIVTAAAGVNLAAHVNHKVRVVGTVEHGKAPAGTPELRPGNPPPAPGVAAEHNSGDKSWSTLTATSVTMISATCTTQSQP